MLMPGRKYTAGSNYRYGFNGKENDNEVKGEGNQQDYGMRIYDPRLGRFLSVDPLTKGFPDLTPYQFASNSPMKYIDLDGLEAASPPPARTTPVITVPIEEDLLDGSSGSRVSPRSSPFTFNAPIDVPPHSSYEKVVGGPGYIVCNGAGCWTEYPADNKEQITIQPFKSERQKQLEITIQGGQEQIYHFKTTINADKPSTLNLPKLEPLLPGSSKIEGEHQGDNELIYRGGPYNDKTFTPRPGRDDEITHPKAGLSTFTTAAEAAQDGGIVQVLSVSKLKEMGFTLSYVGSHVSILPGGENKGKKLKEWAATRPNLLDGVQGQANAHSNTLAAQSARLAEVKVPKRKK